MILLKSQLLTVCVRAPSPHLVVAGPDVLLLAPGVGLTAGADPDRAGNERRGSRALGPHSMNAVPCRELLHNLHSINRDFNSLVG